VILVDTSVWVDHFRATDANLATLLEDGDVLIHPFVVGELAVGTFHRRAAVLRMLRQLPGAVVAHDDEVLQLIAREALYGIGIGYVDAHLLAATRLTQGAAFWTRDPRLAAAAARLGLATGLPH
jgi:predicted nucleic acid-binding protein